MGDDLAQRLIWTKLATAGELSSALALSMVQRRSLLSVLAESRSDIAKVLARQFQKGGLQILTTLEPSMESIRKLPKGLCARLLALPVVLQDGSVVLAAANPTDPQVSEEFAYHLGLDLDIVGARLDQLLPVLRASTAHGEAEPAPPEQLTVGSPATSRRGRVRTNPGLQPIVGALNRPRKKMPTAPGLAPLPELRPKDSQPPIPLVQASMAPSSRRAAGMVVPRRAPAPAVPLVRRMAAELGKDDPEASPSTDRILEQPPGSPAPPPLPRRSSVPAEAAERSSVPPEHDGRSSAPAEPAARSSAPTNLGPKPASGPPHPLPPSVTREISDEELHKLSEAIGLAGAPDEVFTALCSGLSVLAHRVALFAIRGDELQCRLIATDHGVPLPHYDIVVNMSEPTVLKTAIQSGPYVGPLPSTVAHEPFLGLFSKERAEIVSVCIRVSDRPAMVLLVAATGNAYATSRRADHLANSAGAALERILRDRKH